MSGTERLLNSVSLMKSPDQQLEEDYADLYITAPSPVLDPAN